MPMPFFARSAIALAALLLLATCTDTNRPAEPTASAPTATQSQATRSQATRSQATRSQEGIKADLRNSVAAYRNVLPLRVSEDGELIAMKTYDLVLELTFRFVDKNWTADPQTKQFATEMAKAVVNSVGCRNPAIATWLEQDVVVRYHFLDEHDTLFFEHDLKQEGCSTPS